jgi:hypothetical protein
MRHQTILILLTILIALPGVCGHAAASTTTDVGGDDFSRLLEYIALDDLQDPLVVFQDHSGDFDRTLNKENIAFLNKNKELLKKIKTRLKGDSLQWKLSSSSKRRLIVPETRTEYAALFQRYCRESIDFVLERLRSPSPYTDIATLSDTLPLGRAQTNSGVKAFLVHNIADEYIEEYTFYNQDDDSTKIKIKLSNRVFSGKIGSYSSDLVIGENSSFEFIHEPFTLWQNSAENPLNVFIAPVEETLHILMRDATEAAIRADLDQVQPKQVKEVEAVVDDWMAVEEAIVGGLVARLMPEVFSRFLPNTSGSELNEALAERDQFSQYRYLERGIKVVIDMGLEEAAKLYKADPLHFKQLVDSSNLAKAS